jgi:hypothetical protein
VQIVAVVVVVAAAIVVRCRRRRLLHNARKMWQGPRPNVGRSRVPVQMWSLVALHLGKALPSPPLAGVRPSRLGLKGTQGLLALWVLYTTGFSVVQRRDGSRAHAPSAADQCVRNGAYACPLAGGEYSEYPLSCGDVQAVLVDGGVHL